jgi:Serine protease inhibitor
MQAYQFQKHYEVMREINGSESYELRSANKIFIAKQLKLRECIAHLFQDEVQPVDFDVDPQAARQSINNWVEIQTKRQIKDLIPQDKITRDTKLVLVRWKQNFSCVQRTGLIGR